MLQAAGIRFISFRNEQAAGYAAAAAGFLTGTPAALLTVSGPGVLHGLPGAAHATVNAWPLLHIAGSAAQVRPRLFCCAAAPCNACAAVVVDRHHAFLIHGAELEHAEQ